MENYEINDCVIADSRYYGLSKFTVERVTKTQAILNNGTKLRIDQAKGGREIGATGYGCTFYRKATTELLNAFQNDYYQRAISTFFNRFELKKLNDTELKELFDLTQKLQLSNSPSKQG